MRQAWEQLRDRWNGSWQPWLTDHPHIVGMVVVLGIDLFIIFSKFLFRHRTTDWSWSDVKMLGTIAGYIGAPFLAWWLTGLDIRRRQRRDEILREQKICLHCGYDMRAAPERCPECGNRVDEPVDLFR